MSSNDQKIKKNLKRMSIQEGSRSYKELEKVKKAIREKGMTADDYEKVVKVAVDYIGCIY